MNLRKGKKGTVEVHTSALNDIMFFLLLFFLLASAVVNPTVVKLLVPQSSSGQQSTAKKAVTVTIDDNLKYTINKKSVTLTELQTELERYQKIEPDLTVILYVARNVTYQDGFQVSDIANKMKLKLVVAVEPKK
jgi:biopolymer transport protein ExbD